jgi:hypothetical protein
MTSRNLRDAGQLLAPAVEGLGDALGAPAADAPLLALARRMAATIDAMPDGVAVAMLPNHAGPLIKVLAELEARANARRKPAAGKPSRLNQLRAARVESDRAAGYGRIG